MQNLTHPPKDWHKDGEDTVDGTDKGDNRENHKPVHNLANQAFFWTVCNPPEVKEGVKLSVPHICCQDTYQIPATCILSFQKASGTIWLDIELLGKMRNIMSVSHGLAPASSMQEGSCM